jgi:hypothetical protein
MDKYSLKPEGMPPEEWREQCRLLAEKLEQSGRRTHLANQPPRVDSKTRKKVRTEKNLKHLAPKLIGSLMRHGNAVAILDDHNKTTSLARRLDARVAETGTTGGRVLTFDATGRIKGEPYDEADTQATLGAISELRRNNDGFNIVAFTGIEFGTDASEGSADFIKRMAELIQQQRERSPYSKHGLGILAVGQGDYRDLPAHSLAQQRVQARGLQIFNGSWLALGAPTGVPTEPVSNTLSYVPSYLDLPVNDPELLPPEDETQLGHEFGGIKLPE